ncbi:hypothetical protein [Wolbachia endosymbiont (group A) of Ennomos erosarius]
MIPYYSRKEMSAMAKLVSSQCVTLGSSLFHHGHYFMLLESVVH